MLINQRHPEKEVLQVIYLLNKGKHGHMLIGFLSNKESTREMRADPLQHYYCLCR